MISNTNNLTYIINTDGGARGNPGPAAIGFVIKNNFGDQIVNEGHYLGETTNNTAEYQAVIFALNWIKQNKPDNLTQLEFYLDSNLVVNQVLGKYKIKEPHLQQLAAQIHSLLAELNLKYNLTHIPRSQNKEADSLVNKALDSR